MPRFVVLTHDFPVLHWDLMLEADDALRTWRLDRAPGGESPIRAKPLNEHRVMYLNYEGPVSGGRGSVSRWDAGEYEHLGETEDRLTLRFSGTRLRGAFIVKRSADDAAEWEFIAGDDDARSLGDKIIHPA